MNELFLEWIESDEEGGGREALAEAHAMVLADATKADLVGLAAVAWNAAIEQAARIAERGMEYNRAEGCLAKMPLQDGSTTTAQYDVAAKIRGLETLY